jgi:hypothetical protein
VSNCYRARGKIELMLRERLRESNEGTCYLSVLRMTFREVMFRPTIG